MHEFKTESVLTTYTTVNIQHKTGSLLSFLLHLSYESANSLKIKSLTSYQKRKQYLLLDVPNHPPIKA